MTIRYNTGDGSWNDKNTWSPTGVPSLGDTVVLASPLPATVTLTGKGAATLTDIQKQQVLALIDGNLSSSVRIIAGGLLDAQGGSNSVSSLWLRDNSSRVEIGNGASLAITPASASIENAGHISLSSSDDTTSLRFTSSLTFTSELDFDSGFYRYEGGTITLSDLPDGANIIVPLGDRGYLFNVNNTIQGAGLLGQIVGLRGPRSTSIENEAAVGDGSKDGDHSQGVIRATGTNHALIVDTGPTGTLTNGGLMQGLGWAGLFIGRDDPTVGVSRVVNTGLIEAGGGSKVTLAHVDVTQSSSTTAAIGTIRTTGEGAKLALRDTTITGGTVATVAGSLLAVAGENMLTDVTLASAGTLAVSAGAHLELSGGTATIAGLSIEGDLTFDSAIVLQGAAAGSISSVNGQLRGDNAGASLTNVDNTLSGHGLLEVRVLSNQSDGRIVGFDFSASTMNNAGTIIESVVEATKLTNTGTIANSALFVPYSGGIDNGKTGIITNATFGSTIVNNRGLIQSDGSGSKQTLLSGTEILGGELATSNGGVIEVRRFDDHITALSPDKIAAGTRFSILSGAVAQLSNVSAFPMVLDNVSIAISGAGDRTTLFLDGYPMILQGGGKITLSNSVNNELKGGTFTNVDGVISGAGTIEFGPLDNQAAARIVANGSNPLTVNVVNLKNNGTLEAVGGTLEIVSSDIIQGGGKVVVAGGGTVDLSGAAGYLGHFVYDGPGVIHGSIAVPAGTISGFATGDSFIFGKRDALGGSLSTAWQQAGAGGTLTIKTSPTETYATLQFAGIYDGSDFTASQVTLADGTHVAVTFTGALRWTEAVDGNWLTPSAWNPTRLHAPGKDDNALITATGAAYTVTVDRDVTVKSVATGAGATVDIKDSTLIATSGTASVANAGTIKAEAGAAFVVGGAFHQDPAGRIVAAGASALIDLDKGATVSGGRIEIETGGALSAVGGLAKIVSVAIENDGTIVAEGKTLLALTNSQVTGNGAIYVAQGSALALAGSTLTGNTIDLEGALRIDADVTLDGAVDFAGGIIVSGDAPVTLRNANVIDGIGSVVDEFITLINDGSIISESGEDDGEILLDTADNTIVNNGYIAAWAGGSVTFASAVNNSFAIYASGGTVELGADVANVGIIAASDADSAVIFKGTVDNAGSISATAGGLIDIQGKLVQQASGALLASGEGSVLKLHDGSGVSGGQIDLTGAATFVVEPSSTVTLSNTDLSLDATSEVSLSVFKSTLNLVDTQVDSRGDVKVSGSTSSLSLAGATTLHGGNYFVEQGAKVRVSGKDVVLDDAVIHLGLGTKLASDGSAATLTNSGRLQGGLGAVIGDANLTLHNKGIISPDFANDLLSVNTGANAIVNDGTITGLLQGGVVSIASSVQNTTSGKLLSGKGTLTMAGVDNAGLISADPSGHVQVRGALHNTGQVTAKGGGVLEAVALDNAGKVFATGAGSKIAIGNGSVAATNSGQIIADLGATVTLDGGVNDVSGGQLLAQGGGRITVVGAASGGIATLTDSGIVDFRGSATVSTTTNAVFIGSTIEHLILGNSARFAGSVAGMEAGDTIDLTDIVFAANKSFYDPTTKLLNVSDGTTVVKIQMVGTYAASDFTFASDGKGGTLVTDKLPPAAPSEASATGDAYVVVEGAALMVGTAASLLLNDTGATAATLKSGPAHGDLALADDGTFTYTPAAGFAGIDSFSYQAGNGSGAADEGQVLLYVAPIQGGTLDVTALGGEAQIAALYTAYFGRGADADGFEFWLNELDVAAPAHGAAAALADIASSFAIGDEAMALYPLLANAGGATAGQIGAFLDAVYGNLFNRAPDAAGRAYWTTQVEQTLAAGGFVGEVLVDIMSGARDTTAGQDITTLMGKVAVGLEHVQQQELHGTVWAGASDIAAATALLQDVTSDPASVLTGIRNADLLIAEHG